MTDAKTRRAQRDNLLKRQAADKRAHINLIVEAVRSTQGRIRNDPGKWNKSYQLRGVRRLAAALADDLSASDQSFDAQQFLTDCGYGAK